MLMNIVTDLVCKTDTVKATTLRTWMTEAFPTTKICPHKSDYCNQCFYFKNQVVSIDQQVLMLKVYILLHCLQLFYSQLTGYISAQCIMQCRKNNQT